MHVMQLCQAYAIAEMMRWEEMTPRCRCRRRDDDIDWWLPPLVGFFLHQVIFIFPPPMTEYFPNNNGNNRAHLFIIVRDMNDDYRRLIWWRFSDYREFFLHYCHCRHHAVVDDTSIITISRHYRDIRHDAIERFWAAAEPMIFAELFRLMSSRWVRICQLIVSRRWFTVRCARHVADETMSIIFTPIEHWRRVRDAVAIIRLSRRRRRIAIADTLSIDDASAFHSLMPLQSMLRLPWMQRQPFHFHFIIISSFHFISSSFSSSPFHRLLHHALIIASFSGILNELPTSSGLNPALIFINPD